jgi:hypothetical protein
MSLLRVLAAVLFLLAGLAAFGWLLDQSVERAIGLVALGLLAWVVSTFPPSRRGWTGERSPRHVRAGRCGRPCCARRTNTRGDSPRRRSKARQAGRCNAAGGQGRTRTWCARLHRELRHHARRVSPPGLTTPSGRGRIGSDGGKRRRIPTGKAGDSDNGRMAQSREHRFGRTGTGSHGDKLRVRRGVRRRVRAGDHEVGGLLRASARPRPKQDAESAQDAQSERRGHASPTGTTQTQSEA